MSQKHWDLTSEGKDVEEGTRVLVTSVVWKWLWCLLGGCQPLLCNPCGKQRSLNKVHLGPTAFSGVSGLMCEAEA